MSLPLDQTDAMTITVVAVEAFLSLDWAGLHPAQSRGAVLLFDQILQRVKPLLPATDAMGHVFAGIAAAERLAASIREVDGLAAVV